MVEKLHGGVIPTWERLHKVVESSEFTVEAKTWLSIIGARIMSSRHESEVTPDKALMIAAIMNDLQVNVDQHRVSQIEEACNGGLRVHSFHH